MSAPTRSRRKSDVDLFAAASDLSAARGNRTSATIRHGLAAVVEAHRKRHARQEAARLKAKTEPLIKLLNALKEEFPSYTVLIEGRPVRVNVAVGRALVAFSSKGGK